MISPYVYVGIDKRMQKKFIKNGMYLKKEVKVQKVLNAISIVSGIEKYEIIGRSRKSLIADCRTLFCFFMSSSLKYKLSDIGDLFTNGLDRTTVFHHLEKHDDLVKFNIKYRELFLKVDKLL